MKFGADFARNTCPVPAESVQKVQEDVARPIKHVYCFCAPLFRLAHAFGAKTARFFDRNSRDFACKFLNFRAPAAANARADRFKNTDHLFVVDAQHAQRLLISAVLLAARFAAKIPILSLKSQKFR